MNDQPRSSTIAPRFSGSHTGLDVQDIKQSLIDNLFCGKVLLFEQSVEGSISDYCEQIWKVKPVPVEVGR